MMDTVLAVVLPFGLTLVGVGIGYGIKKLIEKANETKNPYDDIAVDGLIGLLKIADARLEGTQYDDVAEEALKVIDEVYEEDKAKELKKVVEPLLKK